MFTGGYTKLRKRVIAYSVLAGLVLSVLSYAHMELPRVSLFLLALPLSLTLAVAYIKFKYNGYQYEKGICRRLN